MQDLDCLEIFNEIKLTIENIEINSAYEIKNFLCNHKISYIIYNKKKFSHIKICEGDFLKNLSSLEENSILLVSGNHSVHFSKPIFLKKNQTLYSCQNNKQSQIFQIHLQENAKQIQIINLKIQNFYSNIQVFSSENKKQILNSFIKLNDNCEINGLKFQFISKNYNFIRSFMEAEYKENIILKNLEFSASTNIKELCFIELYKTHKFEFINNHAKNHILLKIICSDSRSCMIKSDFSNNSKIQFLNPDILYFENIKLCLFNKIIETIKILNFQTETILPTNQNNKNHLFLINYFDSNSLNFDFSFLNQLTNQNLFFFGLQKPENFSFSFSGYLNLELKITNNFKKLKYISFPNDFQNEIIQNNFFHFQNIFLKINQNSLKDLNQIQTLTSSKILIELLSQQSSQSLNFSENLFNWKQNFFFFKTNHKIQNLFQINHSFRIDEIERNFFLQNKFIFDKKKLNLIDTKFLLSKIFFLKKNLFKENFQNIRTLIIENYKFNQTIEKIFLNQNQKEFFLILLPRNKETNLNFFLISSKKKSIENINQRISKIEKSFYFQNLKSNLTRIMN